MNIAYFTNNYRPFIGGVPIAIDKLAAGLRSLGHKVLIFAPDYGEDSGQVEEPDVFRCPAVPNFNDSKFALPLPLGPEGYARFSDFCPDIVHVHHPFLLGSTGLHMAREQNLPVIFTYHTQYEQYAHYMPWDGDMVRALAVNLGARFANQCDGVIAPSSDIRNMLLERKVEVPIAVVPTGVDLNCYENCDSDWLRRHLALADEDRILLFVSRLAREKNIEFLIEAFARLVAADHHLRLVLIGDGEDSGPLKEKVAEAGLATSVHFTGTLTGQSLCNAFCGSDLFVFSSESETQGMVVLEALAAGLPVVAVDAPGVRDIIINNENGYLTPPADREAFVRAVQKILADSGIRRRFQENALKTGASLSIASTALRVEEVYRRSQRSPHHERQSRFLVLRELGRYGLDRFNESIESYIR